MGQVEKECRWHFAQSLGGQEQGPNEATSDTFKKEKFDSLVRESMQNSLDVAASDDKPVIVTFLFKKAQSGAYPQLFAVRNNIEACLKTWNDDNARKKFEPMLSYLDKVAKGPFDYLEVRDENTTGMTYIKGDRKCGFYSFVKSVGNSSKSSNAAGGSHGFGKAAFPLISKFNTVLVSTLTEDNQYHFEGVCSLCSHELDGKKFVPVGYYCDNDDEEPVNDQDNIPEAFLRKSVGTSVFVMGLDLDEKSSKDAMREISMAAIKHFWMAILKGKLVVRIGIDTKYNEINSDSLTKYAEKLFDGFDDLKRGHKNPRPYIDAVANAGTDDNHLIFDENIPLLGDVRLYMLKSRNGNDYILNMRSPMMLVDHELNRSQYGFYSVFVCTDEKGNEILRMAENALHNEWDDRNTKNAVDKQMVKDALEERHRFIQRCVSSVFVGKDTEELTFGGLDDFLSIPSSLDDDDYNSEFGKPSGELTDEETSSENTELEDVTIRKPKPENLGDVKVKKKRKKKQVKDADGEDQPTGHDPENEPEHGTDDDPDDTSEDEPGKEPEGGEPKDDDPKDDGEDTNSEPDEPKEEDEDEGKKATRVKPLRITYRAYAQTADDGSVMHKLIIHSNRASDRVIIGIISGGENSDEKLSISKSDNGKIASNLLTDVRLAEGKTVITVWFDDDMRHAIKLNVNEDQ